MLQAFLDVLQAFLGALQAFLGALRALSVLQLFQTASLVSSVCGRGLVRTVLETGELISDEHSFLGS